MLYLGPSEFVTQLHQPRACPKIIARTARGHIKTLISNISKTPKNTKNLHRCNSNLSKITKNTKNSLHIDPAELLADLPSFQFIPVINHLFEDPDQAFVRGLFRPIVSDSIDLPPPRPPVNPEHSKLWTCTLPPLLEDIFNNGSHGIFTDALNTYTQEAKIKATLPKPRLYATDSEYGKLLDKAESSGMLHWKVVSQEDDAYTTLANDIQMTLFAVSKNETRSRLISWPRIQNAALPDPPYISLPDPSFFSAFQINGSHTSAFYLDVANMFHNIVLPFWLAELFPMKPIKLRNLKQDTINRIRTRPHMHGTDLDQLVRPLQATMPMGFKWAVFVGHTFSKHCLHHAFDLFKSSRFAPRDLTQIQIMQREQMPIVLSKAKPLLLLIIDDVAGLAVDWPPEAVHAWYRISRNTLKFNLLPVAEHKSCPFHRIELDTVDFIGCQLKLKLNKILPMSQKLEKVLQQMQVLLSANVTKKDDWDRIMGKAVWTSLLNRPLLSCLQQVFREGPNLLQQQLFRITPQSKRELRTLAALLPLAQINLKLPLSNFIVAFDASLTAGAITFTRITPQDAESLWYQAQSERFNPPPPPPKNLPALEKVVHEYKWQKAFIHNWRKPEHINGLEVAAAVLSLEWLTRSRVRN